MFRATDMRRGDLAVALLVCFWGAPFSLSAAEPRYDDANECVEPGGQGASCARQADCELNTYATVCVEKVQGDPFSRTCEIPCEEQTDSSLQVKRADCAIGETCVEGRATPGRKAYFCRPGRFRMDLSMLNQCVEHHLRGVQPVFDNNVCSLQANLSRMLDQNGDRSFDIFDLDLCVLSYLEQPSCDADSGTCAEPDLVACADDDDCGQGLYCDAERNSCQRDCGVVASREEEFEDLERQCTRRLTACNYQRGRCESVDVTVATCEADSQCPAGAYCLLGRCAPQCYRAVDCPGTDWYCTETNRCRALPHPAAEGDYDFEPKNFAVRFARDGLKLDAAETSDRSKLLIMDLLSKKQVLENPQVTFGYRVEINYGLKQDRKCLKSFVDCAVAESRPVGESEAACRERQDDCFVDSTEEWLRAMTPFGTVSAFGDQAIEVELEEAIAEGLSAGTYPATLTAIFDNGDSDSIPITFVKTSPSGEYAGTLTVYMGGQENLLNGNRPLQFGMRLKVTDEIEQWNDLMARENLDDGDDITDVTTGRVVVGQLHGQSAFSFTASGALTERDNEIPFIGLYTPTTGRIRMIGRIEVDADFCISESGPCERAGDDDLVTHNLFGRKIRRRIEFLGPFDERMGRFHGIYREKVSGLAADFDVTLEGGFIMTQMLADDSPLELGSKIGGTGGASRVRFPSDSQVLGAIDAEISEFCVGSSDAAQELDVAGAAWAKSQFSSSSTFGNYLKKARRRGAATEGSALGRTTVFPSLLAFNDLIEAALQALGNDAVAQQDHLNIYDFVSSRILPCDPADPSPPPACVDEDAVRCGLALHQKAILSGWVSLDDVAGADNLVPGQSPVTGENEMFCVDTIPLDGCPARPDGQKALFVLQEHNRFWQDLGQILKFDADRARSDAFLVLFRNEINPFAQGAALGYKADSLRHAMQRYDQLLAAIVGNTAGKMLFSWPARAFKRLGYDWISTMQTIAGDRMSVLAELVDLKRRVFINAGDSDYVFAHHLMQQEYLVQVYLMALQQRWEQELFNYKGQAARAFVDGSRVLAQLNPNKNALGVTPGVVFFENSDPAQTNWRNYHSILASSGGLISATESRVLGAVDNLQGALRDLDSLEGTLHESKIEFEREIDAICGDPHPEDPEVPSSNYCQQLIKEHHDYESWERVRDCTFDPASASNCPAGSEFKCADYSNVLESGANNCKEVVKTFIAATDNINTTSSTSNGFEHQPTCSLDSEEVYVDINGRPRPCVGGEVGMLLQKKALIDLERRTLVGSVNSLGSQMLATIAKQASAEDAADDVKTRAAVYGAIGAALGTAQNLGDSIEKRTSEIFEAGSCLVIVGFSFGTNCPQKAVVKIGKAIKGMIWSLVKVGLKAVTDSFAVDLDQHDRGLAIDLAKIDAGHEMLQFETQLSGHVDKYNLLTQESFNVGAQIEDARFRAQRAVDRFSEKVTFTADHLIGRESGFVLLGDHLVAEAADGFNESLHFTLRMTAAFIHHYNVSTGDAATLMNRAMSLVTLDDVREFATELDDRARDYCGLETVDCDADSNVRVLRYSVRDQLFPELRDIVDARSGRVVTAGEQFHNLITAQPYLRRRVRGVHVTDQIEIPVNVPLTIRGQVGGQASWLIDPLECNQLLDAHDPLNPTLSAGTGNVALNVQGKNLGDSYGGSSEDGGLGISYTLARGGTDLIRGCQAESTIEEVGTLPTITYPIRKHLIGYAPQSPHGQRDDAPAFATRSSSLPACVNQPESGGDMQGAGCWRFFARDRSLSAPDWKVIMPLYVGGGGTENVWITGEGLPSEARPVIEDLVLYFRYRSRPIQER